MEPANERAISPNNVKLLVNRSELEHPWEGQPDRVEQYKKQILSHRVMLFALELDIYHPISSQLAEFDEELHSFGDYQNERKLYTTPMTEHYIKSISVHPSEAH